MIKHVVHLKKSSDYKCEVWDLDLVLVWEVRSLLLACFFASGWV